MTDIVREPPVTLASLRASGPRIRYPAPGDTVSAPTFEDSIGPVLPPPPPFQHETLYAAPAPQQPPSDNSPPEPAPIMSFIVLGDGTAIAELGPDQFLVHNELAAEIGRILLAAYGYSQQAKLAAIATALNLWPPHQEGPAMQGPELSRWKLPEMPSTELGQAGSGAGEVQDDGPLSELWTGANGLANGLPTMFGEDSGAPVAAPDARPGSARGDDGLTLSPFRSLRGDWAKPAHVGEARGEIVGGPDRFVRGVSAGEHAVDGGKSEQGEGKRKSGAKKGRKATKAPRPSAGAE